MDTTTAAWGTLAQARQLAIHAREGNKLNAVQRTAVNYWVDKVSPENFYMDGELFA